MLDKGWVITSTCPMPSSSGGNLSSNYEPTCLVVLENSNKEPKYC